jgi:hypothetical protein
LGSTCVNEHSCPEGASGSVLKNCTFDELKARDPR